MDEDEEGAKTEGRKRERGDGDEAYGTRSGDDEESFPLIKKDSLEKTRSVATALDESDDDNDENDENDANDSSGGSENAMATSSDSESDEAAKQTNPKPKAATATKAATAAGGVLLETLEDVLNGITICRVTKTCSLSLSLRLVGISHSTHSAE